MILTYKFLNEFMSSLESFSDQQLQKSPELTKCSSNTSISSEKNHFPNIQAVCQALIDGVEFDYSKYFTDSVIIAHLHLMVEELMEGEGPDYDYDKLQRIDDLILEIQAKGQEKTQITTQQSQIEQLHSKIDNTREEMFKIEEKYYEMKSEIEEKKKIELDKLIAQQQLEMSDLDKKYSMENLPPKYRKLSADLINIRKLERKLRIMHQFGEAKKLREEGDKREAEEMAANKNNWRKEKKIAKAALFKKHQQQIACFNEKWNRHWQVLVSSLKNEHNKQKLIMKKTKRKIHEVKIRKELQSARTPRSNTNSRIATERSRSRQSQ
ncbi:hypothetical protein TRFO_35635 [Tritrichomonas foetus]|uniref:Uncharacterized protein n=1 Tax=Tritrichomonas foetus TaxID=1144522 RepID=A0A1J4JI76_9EUKA|nr:hypothetical protein TRFO_35635 [Tritrichomonas foetus]|eukprot:OHS98031.1 hypothetical protein TRFO_35635 [Tritrichomonas foetus]